eukprot:TRINITY_DN32258_c0_g1_i1.p1 TRINITY_DN32258_c0_g1~~TRINITY_DN32258_c0_g1_i1.p1  ORF type:complete len:413 (+),score=146.93 TRINITY_DN32258_c0_g1_i1:71-1240(+)
MPGKSRIRTESMIDRLGKKPLSEGYDLWDRDYVLGALRLFQCKLEVAPPFEVAACLDAVGEILSQLDEDEQEEAQKHFDQAKAKYSLINRKVLSQLMECKELEAADGAQAALNRLVRVLEPFDSRRSLGKTGAELAGEEGKDQPGAVGRCYLYRAELLGGLKRAEEGLVEVDTAISLQCDRLHLAYARKGDLLSSLERNAEAIDCYRQAVETNGHYVPALEAWVNCLRIEEREAESIEVIDTCLKLHPRATLIRDKAFILSNGGRDADALEILDRAIQTPPHEETESLMTNSECTAVLHKAKAAIHADAGRFEEANRSLEAALQSAPGDEEAESMRREVFLTLGRDYLSKHSIPQYLDALVGKVLEKKPDDPLSFMAELVEGDKVVVKR